MEIDPGMPAVWLHQLDGIVNQCSQRTVDEEQFPASSQVQESLEVRFQQCQLAKCYIER